MRVADTRQQRRSDYADSDIRLSASRKHRPDYGIVILTAILLCVGLIIMYSISPALAAQGGNVSHTHFVSRQAVAVILGLLAFFAVSRVPLDFWVRWQKPLLILALILSLASIANGDIGNRWIPLGTFSFQPVEFVKFICIVVLAGFFVRLIESGKGARLDALRPLMIAFAAFGIVIVGLQRDLGSAIVLMGISGVIIFIAGWPLRQLLLFAGIAIAVIFIAISSTQYRSDRLLTFLQPEKDCVDVGYHACQAMIAVGSGGVLGLGLGQSVQAYGYLPEAENDSIFAIYAEKFGFVGALVLLGLIGALLFRILNVMQRAPNRYAQLVTAGVFAWLCIQAVINIGAMVGLLPIKGITLPFISYGGTSLIFAMAGVGLVFQISKYTTMRSQHFLPMMSGSDDRRQNQTPTYSVSRRSM